MFPLDLGGGKLRFFDARRVFYMFSAFHIRKFGMSRNLVFFVFKPIGTLVFGLGGIASLWRAFPSYKPISLVIAFGTHGIKLFDMFSVIFNYAF
jgi:hypothetical protein